MYEILSLLEKQDVDIVIISESHKKVNDQINVRDINE